MNNSKRLYAIGVVAMATLAMPSMAYANALSDLFAKVGNKQDTFLSVDKAFNVSPTMTNNQVKVTFKVVKGHYVYRDKIKLVLPKGVKASNWKFNHRSKAIKDPKFGTTAVFDQQVITATTTLSNYTGKVLKNTPMQLKWQGCAKAGLCYPPERVSFTINLAKQAKKKLTR